MINGYTEWLKDFYGMDALGIAEEVALPETMKHTRNNKVEIIHKCNHMIKELEQIVARARQIHVEDDERHAEMVNKLCVLVNKASIAVEDACFYNGD